VKLSDHPREVLERIRKMRYDRIVEKRLDDPVLWHSEQ
jgi:hypothetical protein